MTFLVFWSRLFYQMKEGDVTLIGHIELLTTIYRHGYVDPFYSEWGFSLCIQNLLLNEK